VEIVKVSTQAPQVLLAQDGSIPRAGRAQAVAGDGGESGQDDPRVAAPSPEPDAQQLHRAAEDLAGHFNLKMEVDWDDRAGRQVLKVMSQDGERVLVQFPAKAALEMAERVRSGSSEGLLTSLV
jgi:uncharacterized FlaG/YvyC family protein